jgi:hypothetical protein
MPVAVLLLFAVGCSFPGERVVDLIVWLTVFGAIMASQTVIDEFRASLGTPRKLHASTAETDRVLQQLVRSRTGDGQDVVRGTLLAEFAPGERVATLYVAFCPPYERLPHVEVESPVEARLVQTLHNGVQIEVRLPRAARTATSATVELFAIDAEP